MSITAEPAIEQATSVPEVSPTSYSARRSSARSSQRHTCRPRHTPSAEEVLEHYLKRVDPDVAASFSVKQRDAIKAMLGERGMTKHAVEIRHSFQFGKRRLYAILLMGKDQRSLSRLYREAAVARPFNTLAYICLAALVSAPVLGVILALGLGV